MNCLEFRRAVGADPNDASPALAAHRAECPACEKYAQEMLRLNGLIKRALDIPVRAQSAPRNSRARWFAMAASVLLVVGIGVAVWLLSYPQASLASDVVDHVEHELASLAPTNSRVAAEALDGVLRAKGMRLAQPLSDVSYLQTCEFRDTLIPHLVVRTTSGPVTVLILNDESLSKSRRFDERGFHGILVPMERGSIAVISTDAAIVDSVAEKIKAAIAWQ